MTDLDDTQAQRTSTGNPRQLLVPIDGSGHSFNISTAILNGTIVEAILTHAKEIKADQILIGSRGRPINNQALLGSVSETVIRQGAVPVTVLK